MITLAWYLLKVIICSGILSGYYYIALRNKIFHRWNRFYLLASVILALSVPLMKINIFQKADADKGTVIRMLQTISSGDEIIIEYNRNGGLQLSSENIVAAVYVLITAAFLIVFFIALYKIFRLKKKYPETKHEGINFINTDAKGTPFSFFNSIFWNNAIDIYSKQGQQIFNHEIAHVKEKHSYDKIFMNIVLIFFWANPFFWLIQKELSMIHEFIADKEALEDNDISSFAEMILQTVYPGKQFSLTNNFFHSPLKRRLIMFTKNKNPKVNYLSRLFVLPLAAFVFLAFTLKMKTINTLNRYEGKKINVIIDAGHGGDDNGAVQNNIKEKDLNLAIAKEILLLNKNQNINIILSREGDESKSVQDRVKFADEKKADLFISIHVDAEENKNTNNGVIIFIPKDDNSYLKESKLLGSALIESFKNNYELHVADDLKQREQGIWVLKANQWPAVLLETGFLSSQADAEYLKKPENYKVIAQNILNGIEKYAEQNLNKINASQIEINTIESSLNKPDFLPGALFVVDGKIVSKKEAEAIDPNTIESVTVLKGESAVKKYGEKAREFSNSLSFNSVVVIKIKDKKNANIIYENVTAKAPLYYLDEKKISKDEMNQIPPGNIESINVIKGDAAIKKYGEKAKYGVIEITMKQEGRAHNDTIPNRLFTKVEYEAEFPGGHQALIKYMVSKIQLSQDSIKDFGTCVLKFIVNTDGSTSHVEATTMKESQLAKIAVDAIRTGPKWIPAKQNGQLVASYRMEPITLTNPN